jgi:glycosyltransferase involved in cell wall biosynthesis
MSDRDAKLYRRYNTLASLAWQDQHFETALKLQLEAHKRAGQSTDHAGSLYRLMQTCGDFEGALEAVALVNAVSTMEKAALLRDQLELHISAGRFERCQNNLDSLDHMAMALANDQHAYTGEKLDPDTINILLASRSSEYWSQVFERNSFDSNLSNFSKFAHRDPGIPAITPKSNAENCPKVSVLIPVYNVKKAEWLQECVESVLSQAHSPDLLEVIIFDDASTNGVASNVAAEFAGQLIYIRSERNHGLALSHNQAMAYASGEYIHIVPQDDKVEPGFYQQMVTLLDRNPGFVAAFCRWCAFETDDGSKWFAPFEKAQRGELMNAWKARIAVKQRQVFPTALVRRKVYEELGGYRPDLPFTFDLEMWGRLAAHGSIGYEPRCLVAKRIHPTSATHGFSLRDRLIDCLLATDSNVRHLPDDTQAVVRRIGFFNHFIDFLHQHIYLSRSEEVLKFIVEPIDDDLKAFFEEKWCPEEEMVHHITTSHRVPFKPDNSLKY